MHLAFEYKSENSNNKNKIQHIQNIKLNKTSSVPGRSFVSAMLCDGQGVSGSEDKGGGRTTVSSSLILLGWVTKVLKKGDKKWGGGGVEGWVTTIF